MALIDTLEAAWYGNDRVPWWCTPLAVLYGGLSSLRRLLYRKHWLGSVRLPVPVVVIGNLTAGGTGKTPLTLAVVEMLRRRGWHPGVVSRGYGGRQRDPALLGDHPDPAVFGDEPCLLRSHGVIVAVGRDRPAAARLLLEAGCNVVIADDGLQHYRLARDVEICVIDGERGFGNGRLLPTGPLREPLQRLETVDLQVSNGADRAGAHTMQLQGGMLRNLRDARLEPLSTLRGKRVHAVAAIGHPGRFFRSLREQGIDAIEHPFPDHHAFAPAELRFDDGLPLVMTEKDAVKCLAFAEPSWWSVPVRAALPDGFHDELARQLDRAVAGRRV